MTEDLLKVVRGGLRSFRLIGELDASTAESLGAILAGEPTDGGDLTLDLTDLTFLDSSGIHLVIRTASALGGRGRLRLVDPRSSVARVIEATGLEGLANLEVVRRDDGRWPGDGPSL